MDRGSGTLGILIEGRAVGNRATRASFVARQRDEGCAGPQQAAHPCETRD